MATTLYRTYRPQTFTDVIGQDHIITTLSNAITSDHIAHAYLFTGGRGTGKTSTARLFAQAVNCMPRDGFTPASVDICNALKDGSSPDIIEIDAASHTGVDNIRDLRETVALSPHSTTYKVYIIDEVHMLSTGAFNALLKTLEEPPKHAIFILATTDSHKVPDTITSRCQRFDFARLSVDHITQKLQKIATAEKITLETEAAELVAIAADGAMRDAESIFAQAIAHGGETITAESVASILGLSSRTLLFDVIKAYVSKDTNKSVELISSVVRDGYNIDTFTRALITTLRSFLLLALDQSEKAAALLGVTSSEREQLLTLTSETSPEQIIMMIDKIERARLASSVIQSLPLEIASIEICRHGNTSTNTPKSTPTAPTTSTSDTTVKKPKPPAKPAAATAPTKTVATPTTTKIETKKAPSTTGPAPESSVTSDNLTVAYIASQWSRLVSFIHPENSTLSGLVEAATPITLEGSKLKLLVKYDLHKEKISTTQNKLTLEKALATIFTTPLTITLEVTEREPISAADASVIAHAQNLLGGEVVSNA